MGCSSRTLDAAPATIQPAQPAQSPPALDPPAGVLRPLGGHPQAAIFDNRTAALVVLIPGPDPAAPASLAVLGRKQNPPRIIELPGPATALTGDGTGTVYLSARGGYFEADLSAGRVARVDIAEAGDAEFTAIARRDDATILLGAADGTMYRRASGAVVEATTINSRADSLVAQGNTVAVLDRAQTSVTTIGADGTPGQTLRAGQGATTMATDPLGRVLVTDTRGGQLLVFGVDPLILRQAYPVPHVPYGLAGSRRLTWVSQTATNSVIGYDLSTGIPVEKMRYPTVQQPNSLAVDDTSDTLYVVSGSGAGVQVIEHATGPR
ncbi:MAG: YncE family protein [Mycobacterium sp.]